MSYHHSLLRLDDVDRFRAFLLQSSQLGVAMASKFKVQKDGTVLPDDAGLYGTQIRPNSNRTTIERRSILPGGSSPRRFHMSAFPAINRSSAALDTRT